MKILMLTSVPVNPPWDQGDKNLAYTLARALPQVDFRVLTTPQDGDPLAANLQAVPLYRSRRPSLFQKSAVYAWLRRQDPASLLAHLVYRPYALSSWLLHRLPVMRRSLHTVPATADQHYMFPGLFFSRRLVTISAYGKRRLQALGLSGVEHVPPGIFTAEWQALEDQGEALKARLGLHGRRVVLFPGHYGPGQGADVLLQALPCVMKAVPDAVFLFACRIRSSRDAQREREAKALLQAAGLGHAARFFNVVPDMKLLVGAADVVTLPLQTQRDKLDIPTSLLEAMAARRPVVISDLAPMNEVLHNEAGERPENVQAAAGLATPVDDAPALSEALVRLLEDPALRQMIGINAQRLVLRRYDIQRSAARYAQIYQEMAHEI